MKHAEKELFLEMLKKEISKKNFYKINRKKILNFKEFLLENFGLNEEKIFEIYTEVFFSFRTFLRGRRSTVRYAIAKKNVDYPPKVKKLNEEELNTAILSDIERIFSVSKLKVLDDDFVVLIKKYTIEKAKKSFFPSNIPITSLIKFRIGDLEKVFKGVSKSNSAADVKIKRDILKKYGIENVNSLKTKQDFLEEQYFLYVVFLYELYKYIEKNNEEVKELDSVVRLLADLIEAVEKKIENVSNVSDMVCLLERGSEIKPSQIFRRFKKSKIKTPKKPEGITISRYLSEAGLRFS